jgi:DNA-binding transcriptional LysR family regulator
MNARPPSWDDLQIFLAAARGGTLAAAATSLGVNASTVHRRLLKLEGQLATRLFDRSPRGYALTPPGEDLLEQVLQIEEVVHAASRQVSGRDQRLSGSVVVATLDDLVVTILAPLFRRFRAQHPEVTIEVALGSDHADLARRQADVAIRIGDRPREEGIVPRRVCAVRLAVYGSRAYLRARGTPRRHDQLAGHDIVRGDASVGKLPMELWLDRHAGATSVAYRSRSMLARVVAVREGIGIGLLPCFMADVERTLVRLGPPIPEIAPGLWLLVHADLRRNARVRAFVDFAHAALASEAPRFEGRRQGGSSSG